MSEEVEEKVDSSSSSGKEMSFWDHLDELRRALFRVAIVIIVLMGAAFCFKDFLFDDVIFSATNSNFISYHWLCELGDKLGMPSLCPDAFSVKIINTEVAAQFFTHMNVSFYAGILVGFPYLLFELWRFVSPALFPKEKRHIKLAFGFGGLLFFVGVLLGYFVIFPITFRFLGTYQTSEQIENLISLSDYISTFTTIIIIMGLIFELPMLALVLSKLGIINKKFLRKYRRYALLIIIVLAAVVTPTGDAITLGMVAMPMLLLYELSIWIVRK